MTYDDLSDEEKAAISKPATDAAAVAKEATEESITQTALCKEATDNANDTANHPTYIGEDNYVYKWNKGTSSYDKTDIYVRGEAFSISRVFSSVASMEAYSGTDLKEGDFVLINTGSVEDPDTGRLYVRTSTGMWLFLSDLSGAIGFTGKTPQLSIGTVSTGAPDTLASVAVTDDGHDTDDNPRYKINFTIPKGDTFRFEDLTAENIAELQRPANDMIKVLEATNKTVSDAESVRIQNEETRKHDEVIRNTAETARNSAETIRNTAESARDSAENVRKSDEDERVSSETIRKNAETAREKAEQGRVTEFSTLKSESVRSTNSADAAAANALKLPKIEGGTWRVWDVASQSYTDSGSPATSKSPQINNGTWWVWDDSEEEYRDTGQSVSSTYQLTKEKIEGVFRGDISTHTHSHLRYRAIDMDSVPTSASLTWTDGMGTHDFHIGNIVRVPDAASALGYGFYMLYDLTEGGSAMWTRMMLYENDGNEYFKVKKQ